MRVDDQGTIVIPCTIADSIGECILDMGSRTSQVSDISSTHDLPKVGYLGVQTIGRAYEEPLVDAGVLKIENFLTEKHPIITIGNDYSQLPQYLGVIGAPQIVGHDVIFVFKAPMAISTLTDDDRAKFKTTGHLFPAIGEKRRLEFQVTVDGHVVHANFDNHCATVFSNQFVGAHQELFGDRIPAEVGDISGATTETSAYKVLNPICIAGRCIKVDRIFTVDEGVLGNFGNGQIEMIIGWDDMEGAVWSFDYTNGIYSYLPAKVISMREFNF